MTICLFVSFFLSPFLQQQYCTQANSRAPTTKRHKWPQLEEEHDHNGGTHTMYTQRRGYIKSESVTTKERKRQEAPASHAASDGRAWPLVAFSVLFAIWTLFGPLRSLFSAYLADKFCRTFGRWSSAFSMFPSYVVEFGSFRCQCPSSCLLSFLLLSFFGDSFPSRTMPLVSPLFPFSVSLSGKLVLVLHSSSFCPRAR